MFNSEQVLVKDFIKKIHRICLDESFERPYGCWEASNFNGYIESLFNSFAAAPFVFADINECCHHAKEKGDKESKEYYGSHQNDGMQYVSIDGKHRTRCLKQFLENEIAFTGRVRSEEHGPTVFVRNKFFKDLKPEEQQHFLHRSVVLTSYKESSRRDLSKIFLGWNSNSQLTNQHKRNAISTKMSSWTREVFNQYETLFQNVFGEKALSKMDPHEFVAKLYLHLDGTKGLLGQAALNNLFSSGEDKEFSEVYSIETKEKTLEVLKEMSLLNRETKKGLAKKDLLLVTLVIEKVLENDLEISNYSDFLNKIKAYDDRLSRLSREKHGKDSENEETIKPDTAYYHEWVRLNWGEYREKRQKKLWNGIQKDFALFSIQEIKKVA